MKSNLREKAYKIIKNLPSPLKNLSLELVYYSVLKEKNSAKTPIISNLFLTDNCNLKCSHCFYAGHLNKEEKTSLEDIKKLVQSLKNPLISVVLTGGETFLRKDIVEICILLDKARTKKIILATNGTLPDIIFQKVKEILNKTNLDVAVQISLDGPEEVHDKIRGVKGTYKKAIETLNKLKQIKNPKLSLSISTTVSKKNYPYIESFIEETKKLNVFHGIQFVRSASQHVFNIDKNILSDFDSSDNVLSKEEMLKLQELVKKMDKGDSHLLSKSIELVNDYFIRVLDEKKRFMNCTAGYVDAIVYPSGDVSICEFTKPFANLNDFGWDFHKLWTSDKANEIRNKTKSCVCTHQCNLLNSLRYDKESIKRLFEK